MIGEKKLKVVISEKYKMFVEEKEKYFVTTYTSLWFSNHRATRTEPVEKACIRTESIRIYREEKLSCA